MSEKTAEELVLEITALENKIKPVQERIDFLKDELRARVQPGDEVEAGEYVLTVGATRRFNAKKAKALLSEDEFALVSEPVAVGARVKAMFPEVYEEMQDEGKHRLTIRTREDEEND